MIEKRVYMDNAATTPVSDKVLEAMLPWLKGGFGNPSSIHSWGRDARRAIGRARRAIADALGVQESEIFFTSGGTESDNWAIRGAAQANAAAKRHIITSQIEHHAVLHTCQALESAGWDVTYLPVDDKGFVSPAQLEAAIRPDTALVTIMVANNEIGTIEPVGEIGRICRERGVLFHTDAVQAIGHTSLDIAGWGIDMLSLSGHKLHAPKGVGALYIRGGVHIENLIYGGQQEWRHRGGTENVASIVGLGVAVEDAITNLTANAFDIAQKRDYMLNRIEAEIPYVRLNGDRNRRLPGNLNITLEYLESESVLLNLDLKGIAASSGSACTSGSVDPSHVLTAIGLPRELANGALRFSLDTDTTYEDIDYTMDELKDIVQKLRAMSPEYSDIEAGD